jgi:lipoprotein-anchoring transpeptidase ErfK/SrfK
VVVGAGALAVACGTAFAGAQFANRVEVSEVVPAPDSAVATARPLIALDATNVIGLRDLSVTVDGRDVTARVGRTEDGRLVVSPLKLADGEHTVDVRFGTRNVFSRTVERTWSFTVDTKLPALAVRAPKPGAETPGPSVRVAGTAEPDATVRVAWKGGSAEAVADAKGVWQAPVRAKDGRLGLTVTAVDAAGNAAVVRRAAVVDSTAPTLRLAKLPTRFTTTDAPTFTGTFGGETAERIVIGAVVNGRRITPLRDADGVDVNGDPIPGVTVSGRTFTMNAGRIAQGANKVTVFAQDPAGNRAEKTVTLSVDSTEEFGSRDLVAGARGGDVKELQRQLVARGFKKTRVSGVYDARTAASVRRYQEIHKLTASGAFTQATRTAFVGRIVVDLSRFRIAVVRDGKVIVRFPIAHGTRQYPTPTGTYRIVNKQKDPTWTPPPDSDWAKGLGPIPPGPGNPLGTRWMGTSAPYVGIHGTPASGSIGTRASHGCIRMRIPDAERIYEEVAVGMPVKISY